MSDYIDSYQTQGLTVLLRYPQKLTAIQQTDLLEWLEFQVELAKKRCARMNDMDVATTVLKAINHEEKAS